MTDEQEVCKGVCHYHKDRDELMKTIEAEINDSLGPTVNKHQGYWKFFFWGVGATLSIMGFMTAQIWQASNSIRIDVSELRQMVAIGAVEHGNNVQRLDHHSTYLKELDGRIRQVEHKVE